MTQPFNEKTGLSDLMKKAQEMQKKMQEIQKQVSEMEVTGQAGGGLIQVTMNGQHRIKRVTLDPKIKDDEAIMGDLSILADLFGAAVNDAATKIDHSAREKMSALTGIKLPDGFDLPTDGG